MTVSASTSYSILEHLSSSQRATQQKNLNILFLGFAANEIDPLLSLIRTGRMAPRGRRIGNEQELEQALHERSWDLLLCTNHHPGDLQPNQAVQLLQQLNRDLPVIELSEDTSQKAQLLAFQNNINALLPEHPGELLLHVIQREMTALHTRRRLRNTEAVLEVTEHHYHEQIANSRTAIGYIQEGKLAFCNPSLIELLGYDHDSPLGTPFDKLILPEQRSRVHELIQGCRDQHQPINLTLDLNIVRADNSSIDAQVLIQSCRFKNRGCLVISILPSSRVEVDVTPPDEDPLTGLKNDAYLMQKLDETAQRALGGGHDAHLLYLQLDQHASISARSGGKAAADLLVSEVGTRLAELIAPPHLICRIGEDSLAIIFHDPDTSRAATLGRKLCRLISTLAPGGDASLSSTCSIGIVTINDSSPPTSELLNRARQACESVSSGNGYALYRSQENLNPQQDEDAIKRILNAISECRLTLLYQPIVPLDQQDKTHNYEVLIRLRDEHDAVLAPNRFITAVEQSDVMVKMDRWVLERSLQLLHDELQSGRRNRLFINITGRSLKSRSLLTWFASQQEELQVPPELIVFQISETDAAAELDNARRFCNQVRRMGCQLCLKHFGSSPNSHIVFDSLETDYIKLDGSWVQDLQSGDLADNTLRQMLEPAIQHRKVLIAPLVETTRVIGKLFRCGVQLVQGYYLQPPREKMDYDFFEKG